MDCKNVLRVLCHVCGMHTPKKYQREFTDNLIEKYLEKFNFYPIFDDFAPNIVCRPCSTILTEKREKRISGSHLANPMIWQEPDINHEHCYPCLMPKLKGSKWTNRGNIEYPGDGKTTAIKAKWTTQMDDERERSPLRNCISTINTSEPLTPIPVRSYVSRSSAPSPALQRLSMSAVFSMSIPSQSSGELYQPPKAPKEIVDNTPTLISQKIFADMGRQLCLTKNNTELLGSILRSLNLLETGVITTYLRHDKTFENMYAEKVYNWDDTTYKIVYCSNLEGLFEKFNTHHNPDEWRLFIDGSTKSLKALLLHNGNLLPSIPVAYSRKLPEKYENMEEILDLIKYREYNWKVILDFKLINIISGMGPAQSKFPCFLCLWDKNTKEDKYTTIHWQERPPFSTYNNKKFSSFNPPLVAISNILMPPLHIKLGLVNKLFSKVYQINEPARELLRKITGISEAKVKLGVYDGTKVRLLFKSIELPNVLSTNENNALNSLKKVCEGFLGNNRSPNYKILIAEMFKTFKKLEINVTLKMHALLSHLESFPPNCGDYSDEQGERAHQDFLKVEQQFNGKNMVSALETYCNSLVRETDPASDRRKTYTKRKLFYNPNLK